MCRAGVLPGPYGFDAQQDIRTAMVEAAQEMGFEMTTGCITTKWPPPDRAKSILWRRTR